MSFKQNQNRINMRYELVAPDGGWGYVIWISVAINMVANGSFIACFGKMYSDIFDQLNMGSTEVRLLNGICVLSISVAGFMTAPLLNCISLRKLGMIAAIILNTGTLSMAFINSKALFYFCGILQGFGNGILFNISISTINEYFVKKRRLSVTVTQTISEMLLLISGMVPLVAFNDIHGLNWGGAMLSRYHTGLAGICAPLFIKVTGEAYGSRGCIIFVAAIYMHVFMAIALMQPVAWHMKKVELPPNKEIEMKSLLTYGDQDNPKVETPEIKLQADDHISNDGFERKRSKHTDSKVEKGSLFKMMFKDLLDFPFLKSFLLSNASVGLSVCVASEMTFLVMLPKALYSMGWSEVNVAWALSLINIGDLVAKAIFILFNSVITFGSHEIYVIGLIIAFFSRLGMLWSDNETVMITFITIMGISRCIIALFIPLVIVDSVGKDKFTSAMGIVMLLYGVNSLILEPLIGAIRDLTNSYGTAFYIITSCYGIVIIFWSIELLYKKNKHKRLPKKEARTGR